MWIFLPVAGLSINLFLLVGVGSFVGFLSGLLGVGGGFLLTPILMFIGIPATVAAASDSCQIVAASSSGVAAHFRLGNVDHRMGGILLFGGLIGIRVITSVISPEIYGQVALVLGMITLSSDFFCAPILHGVSRFFLIQSTARPV